MALIDNRVQRDVLICDDVKAVCDVLKTYCENMGCFKNIVVANDGITATQKLRNQKFALILLDIYMPKKTGLDLIDELDGSDHNSKDRILVVSGELEKDLIAKILSRGVKNFLVKPFDEQSFQEKVLKILGNK